MIAILGALDGELAALREAVDGGVSTERRGVGFLTGRLSGKPVVIAATGVGKVLSAMVTERAIAAYDPDIVLFLGIAGALNRTYTVGDTVVARDCVQHDVDVTAFGVARGQIPFTPHRFIACDSELVHRASQVSAEPDCPSGNVAPMTHVGRIATGDVFVRVPRAELMRFLTDDLCADAVDMEGASAALVSIVNGRRFLLVRVISDLSVQQPRQSAPAGRSNRKVRGFLPWASRSLLRVARRVVEEE